MAARFAKAPPTPLRIRLADMAARLPAELQAMVDEISRSGGTPLVVAEKSVEPGRDPTQGHRQRRHA